MDLWDFGKGRMMGQLTCDSVSEVKRLGYAFLRFCSSSQIHQHPLPMIHVDAFLYDDDVVDSLCEEGKMSRSYCTECGSYKTASLGKCSFGNKRNKLSLTKLVCAVTQLDKTTSSWWRTRPDWCNTQARIISHNQWKEPPTRVSWINLQCMSDSCCLQKLGR